MDTVCNNEKCALHDDTFAQCCTENVVRNVSKCPCVSTETLDREAARVAFEADAGAYDFDLTRTPGEPLSPEPWSEYVDEATGHRWAGWLARTGDA